MLAGVFTLLVGVVIGARARVQGFRDPAGELAGDLCGADVIEHPGAEPIRDRQSVSEPIDVRPPDRATSLMRRIQPQRRMQNSPISKTRPATAVFISQVLFSPDGSRLVAFAEGGNAHVWDLASGRCLATIPATGAQFSPDGRRVVKAAWDGTARVWDTVEGTLNLVLR